MKKILLIVILGTAVYSCAPKVGSKQNKTAYSEDISQYRPSYDVNEKAMVKEDLKKDKSYPSPTYDKTTNIDALVADIAEYNSKIATIDGYTIIIPGSDRQDATRMRQQVYGIWPELKPQLKYESPNFKVVVGQFYSKIEAQRIFTKLKEEFPKALLVPERVRKPQ